MAEVFTNAVEIPVLIESDTYDGVAGSGFTESPAQTNVKWKGVEVIINVTSLNGDTPVITPEIQARDPATDGFYPLLSGAAISTVTTVFLTVHPDLTAAASLVAKRGLPYIWKVSIAHTDSKPIDFSVGANYLF